jgi:hypothetical protein
LIQTTLTGRPGCRSIASGSRQQQDTTLSPCFFGMERIMSLRRQFLRLVALAFFSVISVSTCLAGSVTLTWSAPGDDSLSGHASRFDLRYSNQTITSGTFSQATAAGNLPSPGPPGATQSTRIDGLQSGLTYFFAIKCADEASNWSVMSNVISGVPHDVAGSEVALGLRFSAPWPNPAREGTRFRVELPGPMRVQVEVFDVGGRRVRTLLDEPRRAGIEDLTFDLRDDHGSQLAQGIYLVRARLGEAAILRRLVVTR